jgi:hypothetical protein
MKVILKQFENDFRKKSGKEYKEKKIDKMKKVECREELTHQGFDDVLIFYFFTVIYNPI